MAEAGKRKPSRNRTAAQPLLGAHMSIAGGMALAIERGESIGCTAIQVFLKNNNRWVGKPISAEDAEAYRAGLERSGISHVFAHDCYLINLASPDDELHDKSIRAMIDEVERATLLGVPFIVLHPGSHMGEGAEWGLERIRGAVDRVLEATADSPVRLAFENTAGQGTNLGYRFEQLAALIEGVRDSTRTGICLDTCHAFAAGYDLRARKDYLATLRALDNTVGLERLLGIHLNDSKKELGSRVDRHEHIGQGHLGLEPFRHIMNDRRLAHVPKVLETHKGPDMREDVENMQVLRGLIKQKKAA